MGDFEKKEVDFHEYCPKCKYCDTSETAEPCDSCLEIGVRENSRVPEEFKEGKNSKNG